MDIDIDDALEAQETGSDLALVATVSLTGPIPKVADLDSAGREEIVVLLEQVRKIEHAARDRRKVLEYAFIRAGMELGAKEIKTAGATVRLKLSQSGYVTHDTALRDALITLVGEGDLSKAEVDAAVPEIVSAKADHRKVNALSKRGDRVREAIEANREKREPDPLSAKVEIHRAK